MDTVEGVRFVADPLQKQPDGPLVIMDRPWETELLYYQSLHYDPNQSKYVLEYTLAGGDKERAAERAQLPSTVCRAVSQDGLVWTKPSLGLVDYQGSTDNNLVPSGQEYVPPRAANLGPSLSHDFDKARFRRYDLQNDGPVNTDHLFVTAVKRSFVNQCTDASSHPYRVGSWPMEKRGNEYLVLTDTAILYLGVGMDRYHSTEKITLHVEDKSTGNLYYFFRPGAPNYPPHDAPYDNMHMTRRCLGVMWTGDGLNWQRRLVAVPDENDAPGTEFYYITAIADRRETTLSRPAMDLENHWNKAAVEGLGINVGTLTIYDAKANRIWPELVYASDLLHWHRLAERHPLIPNGSPESFGYGLIKIASAYHVFNSQWWFPYQAINTLHQDYIGLAKMRSLDELRETYPNYAELPGFSSWKQYWQRCKSMRYYTGIGRCKSGRVCHAEPVEEKGTLTTVPIVLSGDTLLLNAIVPPAGSLQVEVLDEEGRPLPGFQRGDCKSIEGDSLSFDVAWEKEPLSRLQGKTVHLRFLLDSAKLYSFQLR